MLRVVLQVASVAIMSRLLPPADFGLLALVLAFVGVGALLRDFGLPTAALQADSLSDQQASNLLFLNVGIAAAAAAVLSLLSPLLAGVFGEPRIAYVLPVMSIALIFGGASAQYQVHLARKMRFLALASMDILAPSAGLAAGVLVALVGGGYWALVAQALVAAVLLLMGQCALSRWRPRIPQRGHGTRSLVRSASHFGAAQILTYISSNTDTVLVGASFGATQLGYYNRAFQLLTLPTQAVLAPLTNVVVPTVSKLAAEGRSIQRSLLEIQTALAALSTAVFLCAFLLAPEFLPLLLGPGWGDSVAIFRILAIGGAVQSLSFVSYWSFILYGLSKQLLYYNLVTKLLTVLLLIAGSAFSVYAVAAAYSLALLASWPINLLWLSRCSPQQSRPFALGGTRIVLLAALSAAVGECLRTMWSTQTFGVWGALAATLAALVLYTALVAFLPPGAHTTRSALRSFRR